MIDLLCTFILIAIGAWLASSLLHAMTSAITSWCSLRAHSPEAGQIWGADNRHGPCFWRIVHDHDDILIMRRVLDDEHKAPTLIRWSACIPVAKSEWRRWAFSRRLHLAIDTGDER